MRDDEKKTENRIIKEKLRMERIIRNNNKKYNIARTKKKERKKKKQNKCKRNKNYARRN